jgi:cytochrome P450/NADPH-cytochrome P450 reductase
MFDFLKECFPRANRPGLVQLMMRSANAKFKKDIKFMKDLAEQGKIDGRSCYTYNIFFLVLSSRRAHPTDKNDILNKMIFGKDPETGQGLSDENIINNVRDLFSQFANGS